MSKDKKMNLVKAVFFFFVAVSCLIICFMGVPGRGKYYPMVGVPLGIFVAVGYLKKAFDKY